MAARSTFVKSSNLPGSDESRQSKTDIHSAALMMDTTISGMENCAVARSVSPLRRRKESRHEYGNSAEPIQDSRRDSRIVRTLWAHVRGARNRQAFGPQRATRFLWCATEVHRFQFPHGNEGRRCHHR